MKNRAAKLKLLANIIQGKANEATRQQLHTVIDNSAIIGIINIPNDEVTIQEGNKQIRLPYEDVNTYAQCKGKSVIFLIPDNGRNQ